MAIFGYKTILKIGDGASPEVYTSVAEVTSVGLPSTSKDAVDTTHTESPDRARTYIGGLIDAGEIPLEVRFLPTDSTQSASAGLLYKLWNTHTPSNFQINIDPDGVDVDWTISAIVTNFDGSAPMDDLINASFTLKVSGKPTY